MDTKKQVGIREWETMENAPPRIYTRKGDLGITRLLSSEKVDKGDLRVRTYGILDELQAHIGFVRALTCHGAVRSVLHEIQKDFFVAGAELASSPETLVRLKRRIGRSDIQRLENRIDEFVALYGLPGRFVVPGADLDSAALHVARSVCRRAERSIVMLNRKTTAYDVLLAYFNRLSDLLFVLAWSLEAAAVVETVVATVVRDCIREGAIQ